VSMEVLNNTLDKCHRQKMVRTYERLQNEREWVRR